MTNNTAATKPDELAVIRQVIDQLFSRETRSSGKPLSLARIDQSLLEALCVRLRRRDATVKECFNWLNGELAKSGARKFTKNTVYIWAHKFDRAYSSVMEQLEQRGLCRELAAFTIAEVSQRLSMTEGQVASLIASGELRSVVILGQQRVPAKAIDSLLSGVRSGVKTCQTDING